MIRVIAFLIALSGAANAETIVAARTIPAHSLIAAEDLLLRDLVVAGGESDPLLFVGMEARVALFAGRPIRARDVSAPASIERNQIVSLIFNRGGLMIMTEGRSLARAGLGDIIRVMNLSSRTTVSAKVGPNGVAYVTN